MIKRSKSEVSEKTAGYRNLEEWMAAKLLQGWNLSLGLSRELSPSLFVSRETLLLLAFEGNCCEAIFHRKC